MTDFRDERVQLKILENLYGNKKYEEVEKTAKELHDHFPTSFQIKLLRVKALKELKRFPDAEDILRDLIKVYPENVSWIEHKRDVKEFIEDILTREEMKSILNNTICLRDKTIISVSNKDLKNYGYNYKTNSIPSAYLILRF